jgi:hypothetical protein
MNEEQRLAHIIFKPIYEDYYIKPDGRLACKIKDLFAVDCSGRLKINSRLKIFINGVQEKDGILILGIFTFEY